jgi:hypothetical protein
MEYNAKMQPGRAVIIHGLDDLRFAIAPAKPVTLLSSPGAALFGGCRWWAELLWAGGFTGPALLDCGDAPGRALEAIRLGLKGVVLGCDAQRFAVVAEIAADVGVVLLPAAPPALDLGLPGAKRRLTAWLDDNA